MKPHLPKCLIAAILASSLSVSAEEISFDLPSYDSENYYHLTGSNLTLNQNITFPAWDSTKGVYGPEIDWSNESGGVLQGSGSLSAPDSCDESFDFCVSSNTYDYTSLPVFTIESGITMQNVYVYAYDADLVCKNTFKNAEFMPEVGSIDLTQATLNGSSVFIVESWSRIKRNTFNIRSLNSGIVVSNVGPDDSGVLGSKLNPVLEGDVVLDAGGSSLGQSEKEWDVTSSFDVKAYVSYEADENDEFATLEITGDLKINSKTAVIFFAHENEKCSSDCTDEGHGSVHYYTSEYLVPDKNNCLIICSSVNERNLRLLTPYTGKVNCVDMWNQVDNTYTYTGSMYTKPISGGEFYAVAGTDGRVYIYLTTDGSTVEPSVPDEPEVPDIPEVPAPGNSIVVNAWDYVVLGGSAELTPSASRKVYMQGGQVDARALSDSLLNNDIITGSSGTLITSAYQNVSLTGSSSVPYSIEGASSTSYGAKLEIGTYGSSGNVTLSGSRYATSHVAVLGGTVTIGSSATLGMGGNGDTLDLSRYDTHATNFGTVMMQVNMGSGSSLLNQNLMTGAVMVGAGATAINNGTMSSLVQVARGGKLYGSGNFASTELLSGAALHVGNSPGYQHHESLTLNQSAELYFYVEGSVPASASFSGDGTYSVLEADGLYVASRSDSVVVNVEISTALNAYTSAPLVLNLMQADASNLSQNNFVFQLEDNGLLPDGASLHWDSAKNILSLTINPSTATLEWAGDKKAVWQSGAPGWQGGAIYGNGADVSFTRAGSVSIAGAVAPGSILVNSSGNLTFKSSKAVTGCITGSATLTKKGGGTLTLNPGNESWTGDIYLQDGTLKVKDAASLGQGTVYLQHGTLHLGSKAVENELEQSGAVCIKSGKKFQGSYKLTDGELLKGSVLNVGEAQVATLERGRINGTLSGDGQTRVTGMTVIGERGQIKTDTLVLMPGSTLTTSLKGLNMGNTASVQIQDDAELKLNGNLKAYSLSLDSASLKTYSSKAAALSLAGALDIRNDSTVDLNGKVTTRTMQMQDSTLSLEGGASRTITVKESARLNNSSIVANARMSFGDLSLSNSYLYTSGWKSQNMTVKNMLTIDSSSSLTLSGKLSAGSLSLNGGTINLISYRPQSIKVKDALTIASGSRINLGCDFLLGKTYKLITFKYYNGLENLYEVFGMDSDTCLLVNTGNAIVLTVTGDWRARSVDAASFCLAENDDEAVVATSESAEPIVATRPQTNPVADALVQANWGQLEASRAFVNAMVNRSMAVQLGNGERAVWASAIGSSSRHDTAGGHNGADTNVSGGAFGLETQVGRASLFGLALGNSWTRVSAHGFGTIEQDTTHLGVYGQTNWRSGISADWSAAYGRSESESMGSDWNQKHLQLDGRVSYNHELNARTVLSPFAGVQYYASDSAAIGTTDTGSLQNLRAEIGMGASHRTGMLGVYGEIALHQDLARNNPIVSMEGVRSTGMNPGCTGINFTIGASYELSDKWSVNASYTGEFVENANSHSANVGATYKF